MAEHNALKYWHDFTVGLKRMVGLDDAEEGITRVSETLSVALDPWSQPDFAFSRKEYRWAVSPNQGGVAAELSSIGIRNPTGSNVLVVVEEVEIANIVASTYHFRLDANSIVPASLSSPTQSDTRIPNLPNAAIVTQSYAHHQAANFGSLIRVVQCTAGVFNTWFPKVILAPGFSFVVTDQTANQAMTVNLVGRERRFNPGETLLT